MDEEMRKHYAQLQKDFLISSEKHRLKRIKMDAYIEKKEDEIMILMENIDKAEEQGITLAQYENNVRRSKLNLPWYDFWS